MPRATKRRDEQLGSRSPSALSLHAEAAVVPQMSREQYALLLAEVERDGVTVALEITADGVVLDGRQRLRAARELELTSVPVRVVEPVDQVEHMLMRALARRHLSESQRAALVIELDHCRENAERGEQRRRANLLRGRERPEVAALPPRGRTRELAATSVGVSPRTVQEAITVRRHDPELFARVKSGELRVHTAARRVRRRLRDARLAKQPSLPKGPFELIYADPPWQLGHPDGAHAPENHYPTMPLSEIAALEVPAANDAILYLWVVNMLLPQGLQVLEAWGFEYKTNLFWVKESIGLGVWARNQHELLLVGRKGSFPPPEPDERPASVISVRRGDHSQKPDEVYALLERAHPAASKLELFARGTPRPGWAAWGNEVETPANGDQTSSG